MTIYVSAILGGRSNSLIEQLLILTIYRLYTYSHPTAAYLGNLIELSRIHVKMLNYRPYIYSCKNLSVEKTIKLGKALFAMIRNKRVSF